MDRQDIPQVTEIDHKAFPTEWPPTNFAHELNNKLAYYIIAYNNDGTKPQSSPSLSDGKHRSGFIDRILHFLLPDRTNQKKPAEEVPILGFAGMWIMADEAHVTSIASHQQHRHQGIGEAMLLSLIELAMKKQATIVTLEARVSNLIAQNLYYKYGFDQMGLRKAYYLDNKEDAVIMSTEYIGSNSFRKKFTEMKKAYSQRWGTFTSELLS
jgi:ribosomal-protein-alanine N-acetyltransferase